MSEAGAGAPLPGSRGPTPAWNADSLHSNCKSKGMLVHWAWTQDSWTISVSIPNTGKRREPQDGFHRLSSPPGALEQRCPELERPKMSALPAVRHALLLFTHRTAVFYLEFLPVRTEALSGSHHVAVVPMDRGDPEGWAGAEGSSQGEQWLLPDTHSPFTSHYHLHCSDVA